jgi:hypothetical protein
VLVYRQTFNLPLETLPIAIPIGLDSDRIVFEAMPTYLKPSWKNAGTITRRFLIHGVGFVKDEPKTVLIGNTLIDFPIQANYYLEFQPFKWIDSEIQLSIWNLNDMPLFNPIVNSEATIASFSDTFLAVTEPITLLADNPNRRGATFRNNSDATLQLNTTLEFVDDTAPIEIAPHGYYELPFNYTGIVTARWSSVDGYVSVREYSKRFV